MTAGLIIAVGGYWFFTIQLALIISPWSWVLVFVGSILPDLIEPPTSYKHRSTFHSWKILKIAALIAFITFAFSFALPISQLAFFFCAGYITHLLMDSTTKMGLPKE